MGTDTCRGSTALLAVILTDLLFPPPSSSAPLLNPLPSSPHPSLLPVSCPDARCAVPPSYHHHHHHRSHARSFQAPSFVHERPAYERPSYERPSYDRPSFDRPIYDRPSFDRPSFSRPLHERPIYDRPSYIRPHPDRWNPAVRVSSGNQLYMLDQEEVTCGTHQQHTEAATGLGTPKWDVGLM